MLAVLGSLISLGFTLHLLAAGKRTSSVTLAWILSFIALPGFSWFFYLAIGVRSYSRRRRLFSLAHSRDPKARHIVEGANSAPLWAVLIQKLADFRPTLGNQIQLFSDTHKTYDTIATAIQQAKHSVFLEYYIFKNDKTGRRFQELLIAAVNRGVQCRLLVDHMGSLGIGKSFLFKLREAGVFVAEFSPIDLSAIGAAHLRNHRKMAIIDGEIGYMGSHNIGDEYLATHWRDSSVQITGPLVEQMEVLFCEDWHAATRERITPTRKVHAPSQNQQNNQALSILLPSGPDEEEDGLEMALCLLFYQAQHHIQILTPYFVPSPSVVLALKSASRRGVEVQILIPKRSDQWYMDHIAMAWANDLSSIGIQFYQSTQTFIHSKVVIIDSKISVLGSANMDVRSFRLNFEVSLISEDLRLCTGLATEFAQTRSQSSHIRSEKPLFRHPLLLIKDGFFKTISPLF